MNPLSPFYKTLKYSLSTVYRNELYSADALRLEHNSRDFLPRVSKLNTTASALVSLLYPYVSNSHSTITNVYYPSTCWSVANYRERMRPATPEFNPGYGGLFTIEFESVSAARAFFDTLEVHKGPSLGAHLTLAQPYVQTVFFREKEWAANYGLKETIVRISVGLEDENALARTFDEAVKKADKMKKRQRDCLGSG
jgi:cystathionine gamma-synthase